MAAILPRGYFKIIIKQAAISPRCFIIFQLWHLSRHVVKSFLYPRWRLSPRVKSILQVGDYYATWFNNSPIWQISRHVVKIISLSKMAAISPRGKK
jgi:hypothetical protein